MSRVSKILATQIKLHCGRLVEYILDSPHFRKATASFPLSRPKKA